MAIEVKIPAVGESITSGVVSAWHKKSGEFVNEGEPLFALETDKVSTDIVAEKAGVLETKVPRRPRSEDRRSGRHNRRFKAATRRRESLRGKEA